MRSLDDPSGCSLTISERLLAVRVVEEALTNALKHGPAASIVRRRSTSPTACCTSRVDNDGELYDPVTAGTPSGTARLATRLSLVGGRLALAAGPREGRPPRGVAAAGGGRRVERLSDLTELPSLAGVKETGKPDGPGAAT